MIAFDSADIDFDALEASLFRKKRRRIVGKRTDPSVARPILDAAIVSEVEMADLMAGALQCEARAPTPTEYKNIFTKPRAKPQAKKKLKAAEKVIIDASIKQYLHRPICANLKKLVYSSVYHKVRSRAMARGKKKAASTKEAKGACAIAWERFLQLKGEYVE